MSVAGDDQSLNYQDKKSSVEKVIYLVHLEFFLKKLKFTK